jgi:signal transduction histidine kinase
VQCDPAQIEQVLLALVMNANDAMPRGGNLWLSTRYCREAPELAIQVRDDGAGIPTDVVSHLFEPFLTTKDNGKSVGLGLAVSHNIVEGHGGRIDVQSEVGKGTTFTVTLPMEASGAMVPAASREASTLKLR